MLYENKNPKFADNAQEYKVPNPEEWDRLQQTLEALAVMAKRGRFTGARDSFKALMAQAGKELAAVDEGMRGAA